MKYLHHRSNVKGNGVHYWAVSPAGITRDGPLPFKFSGAELRPDPEHGNELWLWTKTPEGGERPIRVALEGEALALVLGLAASGTGLEPFLDYLLERHDAEDPLVARIAACMKGE